MRGRIKFRHWLQGPTAVGMARAANLRVVEPPGGWRFFHPRTKEWLSYSECKAGAELRMRVFVDEQPTTWSRYRTYAGYNITPAPDMDIARELGLT